MYHLTIYNQSGTPAHRDGAANTHPPQGTRPVTARDSSEQRASRTSPDRVRDREKLFQLGFLLQPAHIYHIGCICARRVRLRCSFGSSWPLVTHFRRKYKRLNYLAYTGKLTHTTSETP